ncbi:hypothetical protein AVEN_154521-1 [Araneus ventricosus]|uniref:Uncharacterized protein n=1 Tax=Araneus ventricosus TaxID=182803 RepID=A0A4Y2HX48_ARAVE|nr:hypothetical protein AVEN_154521-1 [Araneus ventricosus]
MDQLKSAFFFQEHRTYTLEWFRMLLTRFFLQDLTVLQSLSSVSKSSDFITPGRVCGSLTILLPCHCSTPLTLPMWRNLIFLMQDGNLMQRFYVRTIGLPIYASASVSSVVATQ